MRRTKPNCHNRKISTGRPAKFRRRAKRRIITDARHFQAVKAARTKRIDETVRRIINSFNYDDDYENEDRIRAILEDVL